MEERRKTVILRNKVTKDLKTDKEWMQLHYIFFPLRGRW